MFYIALTIYFLFVITYAAFGTALVYHVRAYALPEDRMRNFETPFIIASLILIILSAYFFSRIPWETFTL
jgi:hypothetical protein